MKFHETLVDVRFDETDEMGIVHHKNYFSWFEISRFKILKEVELDYQELKRKQLGFVVTEAQCQYFTSARFGNTLLIQTILKIERKARLTFYYWIRRKSDYELMAKGHTVHVPVREQKICLSIPDDITKKMLNFIKKFGWDSMEENPQNGS